MTVMKHINVGVNIDRFIKISVSWVENDSTRHQSALNLARLMLTTVWDFMKHSTRMEGASRSKVHSYSLKAL